MPRPFFVAFVARSGSGALKFDLNHHPRVRMRGEAMGGARLPDGCDQTDDNRIAWLRLWWGEDEVARGFKLQFNRGAPQFDDLPRLAAELLRMQPVIFRLGRRDVVRHAVSALRAQELLKLSEQVLGKGDGHIRATYPEELQAFRSTPVAIDIGAFRRMVEGIEVNVRYMDGFLAGFGEVRRIEYEDYLTDRLGVLNTVAAAVEVEPFAEAPPEVLAKISSDDLREAVTNYDELAQAAAELGLKA